jgi:hypothetical protein
LNFCFARQERSFADERRLADFDPKRSLAQNDSPSLDPEIIAQGETDEKDEDDRNEVLSQHQPLIGFRRNEGARTVAAGAEQ